LISYFPAFSSFARDKLKLNLRRRVIEFSRSRRGSQRANAASELELR
jgi:hypothetical protein